ncbi:acetate uptake transporter family protein [Streptomyces flavotricini]|uniref:Acetate uptake transporter family protein n=2 Tax=Streptomyces TaxID=1883 RepID=A0ABS8ED88_9ACTN|nr:acetate uptake transporter family protein [Streptomyces flavotricini]MCC0098985.1 acetate uptake transporter family protein [Streptomyces flavotricini]
MEPSAQAQRGDTWHATVFGGFGLFWMSKACLLQWVLPATDPALRGDVSGCRPSPASWSSSSG